MKKLLLPLLIVLCLSGCMKNTQKQDEYNEDELLDDSINTSTEKTSDNLKNPSIDQKSDSAYPIIKDNIPELNDAILEMIISNYLLTFSNDFSFTQDDYINFKKAFNYIITGGTYPLQPFRGKELIAPYYDRESHKYILPIEKMNKLILEKKVDASYFTKLPIVNDTYIAGSSFTSIRPELYSYFNEETSSITVPAKIIDDYILSKFNTIIDHSIIEEYDANSDTYTYTPFVGGLYSSQEIDEVVFQDEIAHITFTLNEEPDEELPATLYDGTFIIELADGEYKFLAGALIKKND
ncbi:hypothetical protein [Vallitalea guaymasensis]|uniref:Uncharacterized protein n=1 Tax=Vallitalea guaymasensis TaxID=1185412 RepID=A0A8J8M9E1_9FIRM|nr:hypothetical protein [Vallitalea guaymasensis]QUH28633.1 hypothetical protein HYG85_06770 [Vallitalea guaymasensis]